MSKKCLSCNISKDFSSTPGPRYIREGDFSGELFRNEILLPIITEAIENKLKVIVDLDGTAGYGTSFLEESFFRGMLTPNDMCERGMKHIVFMVLLLVSDDSWDLSP